MKTYIFSLSILILLLFTSATSKVQSYLSEKIIGTWNWKTVIDPETQQDMGIDMMTMGMASDVKTEFKKDHTYIESKLKKGSTEYSTIHGEWKIENNETLLLKAKDKWNPGKVLKLSNDSLLVQMNPKIILVMVKAK